MVDLSITEGRLTIHPGAEICNSVYEMTLLEMEDGHGDDYYKCNLENSRRQLNKRRIIRAIGLEQKVALFTKTTTVFALRKLTIKTAQQGLIDS